MYSVKILKDSLSTAGARLTTWELTYPRFVHAELMTHRLFSRNAASSRAIPVEKLIQRIETDPALPVWWGKNQAGMQAREALSPGAKEHAMARWLSARDEMLTAAKDLAEIGLHKQIANRLLEPWMFITVIMSATEHTNWFKLRCHPDAQPELKWVADEMQKQYEAYKPKWVANGDWHLPLTGFDGDEELDLQRLKQVSTARCARVSYLTHDGKRDVQKDIELHDQLATSGHWSPFEHVAVACEKLERHGNFIGWRQYRKFFSDEHAGGPLRGE